MPQNSLKLYKHPESRLLEVVLDQIHQKCRICATFHMVLFHINTKVMTKIIFSLFLNNYVL